MVKKYFKNDKTLATGIILIPISFLLLILLRNHRIANRDSFDVNTLFIINYLFSIIYSILLIIINFGRFKWKFRKFRRDHFICLVVLFSISCFSLNLSFRAFSEFALWVVLYIAATLLALLASVYHKTLPKPINASIAFLMGAGAVITLYFTVVLAPLIIWGIFGAFLFGISLHLLVPAVLLTLFIMQFSKYRTEKHILIPFLAGTALPIVFATFFVVQWNQVNQKIKESKREIILNGEAIFPEWLMLAQELPQNPVSEKIISSGIGYDLPDSFWGIDGLGSTAFDENKKHDPLVVLATLVSGSLDMPRADRTNILKCLYGKRHLANRKLWSGKQLSTDDVVTKVELHPEYRFAYVEKTLTIKNSSTWRRNQQEALYTFYLPEGAVVSSLSLWIEGKEEHSRLTTRQKADSAYATIVGRERRDPALLHWQEGNRVTVTVFPCTPEEPRIFKVGITVPLEKDGSFLKMQNIGFEGPDFANASSLIKLEFNKASQHVPKELPRFFKPTGNQTFEYSGKYKPNWEIAFQIVPVSTNTFEFCGFTYQLSNYNPIFLDTDMQNIYLDINNSWEKAEFEELWQNIKNKNVYVFDKKLVKLENANKDELFEKQQAKNFSLFPVYLLDAPSKSLIVTKSNEYAPHIFDLGKTGFLLKMQQHYSKQFPKTNLYCIGNSLTGYLKSLKEFNVFNYSCGSIAELGNMLDEKKFLANQNSMDKVVLPQSAICIERKTKTSANPKAPNHIARLFAYNWIMNSMGSEYLSDFNYHTREQIEIANQAFVVSPVSSLVVLETTKDYERFGIEENKNSLKNAADKSSGAVPEPHEWTLIIITLFVGLYLYFEKRGIKWKLFRLW